MVAGAHAQKWKLQVHVVQYQRYDVIITSVPDWHTITEVESYDEKLVRSYTHLHDVSMAEQLACKRASSAVAMFIVDMQNQN